MQIMAYFMSVGGHAFVLHILFSIAVVLQWYCSGIKDKVTLVCFLVFTICLINLLSAISKRKTNLLLEGFVAFKMSHNL